MHKVRIDTIPLTGCQVLAGDDRIPGRWRRTLCHREKESFVSGARCGMHSEECIPLRISCTQRGITLTQLIRGDTGRG
jgi:hypothetical protein